MNQSKLPKREITILALGEFIIGAVISLIFFLVGKFNYTVPLGAVLGGAVTVFNFVFLSITVNRAVDEAMEANVEPVSLYDSIYGEGEDTMFVIDKLADETQSDDILIENIALKEALKKLNKREKNIISRRYYNGKTQMEIADEIGISQAQVSRLEKSAIEKLRKYNA